MSCTLILLIISTLKYYNRLCEEDTSALLKEALTCNISLFNNGNPCWLSGIMSILKKINVNCMLGSKVRIDQVKYKLKLRFNCFWKRNIQSHPKNENNDSTGGKLRTYKKFKMIRNQEPYLNVVKNPKIRSILAQFRTSSHKLKIETGRYERTWNSELSRFTNIPPEKRLCSLCNLGAVEDEIHFLLSCSKYKDLRYQFLLEIDKNCPNFNNLDDEGKFVWIMSAEDNNTIMLLAKFLENCHQLRSIID